MLTIFIDNKPYQVKPDQNLLQACLTLGFDLPYFCWHPAMHSVGACRQCAVKQFKDEKDTRGRIVMSCMTPVSEGLRISVNDPDAKAFRSSVIEWLMLNHPHDCPVCDEGGECHLQDMTVMTGHNYRRTRFNKRTHRNQDLGPFVNHEMNRCIACYRCVRFYRDYAGGRDLNVFGSHHHVYFGRAGDGPLESEFSGNLVEICPTGVFTDKTLKQHYTRKWDLQTAPSLCVHCGLGCNIIAGERYGTLRRVLNRYHHDVNGYFLCDRGRFGYEFVNSGKRIKKPLVNLSNLRETETETPPPPVGEGRSEGQPRPIDKAEALERIAGILSDTRNIVGIGSPRASLESNYNLRRFVGQDNFYSGMASQEHVLLSLIVDILQKGPGRSASLHDIEQADAVLLLGEDVTNTAPLIDLAIRQAARNQPGENVRDLRIPSWDANAVRNAEQNRTGPFYTAFPGPVKLNEIATQTYEASPDDISRLGFAIAHELDSQAPPVPGLHEAVVKRVQEIAAALKSAKRPMIVSGTCLGNAAVIQAAANIAWALCSIGVPAGLSYAVPECNSFGLALLNGKDISSLHGQEIDTLVILENDLYRRADQKIVDDLLARAQHVIVIDHLFNATTAKASIVLPAATFAEASGTLVNNEGRCQRFYRVFNPELDIRESWRWIGDMAALSAVTSGAEWNDLESVMQHMASRVPVLKPVLEIAPAPDFTIVGRKIPRQPHRYSGRTAMLANVSVHEPRPDDDPDSALSFSMEGFEGRPPAPLISRYWSPGWNSVQALNKFQQEVGGPLRGFDPGKRLIEPAGVVMHPYFTGIPEAPRLALSPSEHPGFRIFGSEELSMYAPSIIERSKVQGTRNNDE